MTATKYNFSRRAVIIFVTLGLLLGFAVGAQAVNERVTAADASLEKAYVLLEAARDDAAGELSGKEARTYDRTLAKAQGDIARAREHIADAIAFLDGSP